MIHVIYQFHQQDHQILLIYEQYQKNDKHYIKRQKWFNEQLTFYASNYADLSATENISHFHEKFLRGTEFIFRTF